MTGGNEKFQRASRLTKAVEFRRVFSRPHVSQDRLFRVLCRPNSLDRSRLGLAVSKKACARAADRNRLKRIIRESFRKHQHSLTELDVVVLPKHQAATMCNRTLTTALEQHWARCVKIAAGAGVEASEGRN